MEQKETTCIWVLSLSGWDPSSLKPEGVGAFSLPSAAGPGLRRPQFSTESGLRDSGLGPAGRCGAWRFLTEAQPSLEVWACDSQRDMPGTGHVRV